MNEPSESEKLAEKLTVKSTFEISANDIKEFDALLIEIKKKQEQFVMFSLDIYCKWETMQTRIGPVDGTDVRQLTVKKLPSDYWSMFVSRVREVENEILFYLNSHKEGDDGLTVPVFSCNVRLRIEMKDKEAQNVLKDDRQMSLFAPIDIKEKRYHEEMDRVLKDLKPDGKNIESVTFTHIRGDGSKGQEVELKAE